MVLLKALILPFFIIYQFGGLSLNLLITNIGVLKISHCDGGFIILSYNAVLASCILKLCCWVYALLELLILPGELAFISMY